ncbi:phosphodiester glycosidase family protein [Candidatus Daviesbacteria bacterium]|nr:phosphodiester glycosidase family protein [Candidatus Daviesbacteria bacterium]
MNQRGLAPIAAVIILAVLTSAIGIKVFQSKANFVALQGVETQRSTPMPSPAPSLTPTPTPISTPTATPEPTIVSTVKPTMAPAPIVINNTPPGSGYSRQTVSVEGQNYTVSIIAADLNSTKVIVDTASDSDCTNDCPVLSLADYAGRNGAWAGINGSYFCPADYANCAGKANSYDTLLMNKNKRYFNSDNNVYSTVPAAIFSAGSARFVSRSLEWGRDTGVDSVIANYPLLIAGSNINFTEAPNEPKFGGKAARTFIASKRNMVYIGVVYNASMGESAKVLHTMGMDGALNLDQGGSTALWSGGYIAGPGRRIPNAILFVNR